MSNISILSDSELELVAGGHHGGGLNLNVQIGNGGSGGTAVSGVLITNGNKNGGVWVGGISVDSGSASANGGNGGNFTINL